MTPLIGDGHQLWKEPSKEMATTKNIVLVLSSPLQTTKNIVLVLSSKLSSQLKEC